MAKKKVYKLKKSVKIILVLFVLLVLLSCFGYKKYQDYLYTKTFEYQYLNLGYTMEQFKMMESKLSEAELKNLLSYDHTAYKDFIPKFIESKYFIYKNFRKYLSQVVTEEEDFFKYHDLGIDGYDYDNIIALVNTNAINPHYESTKDANIALENLLLVNKYYSLDSTYEPYDLVSIDWKYRTGLKDDKKYIRTEVYDAFIEMWNEARSEGIYLLVDSAYRSYQKQDEVYKSYETSKGTKYADSIAARAGYSEHQTGLCLDIYSKEAQQQATFKDSKAYAWLISNSYKFGFILRYPKSKEKITGYNYESWHYRYVGKDNAKSIYESGLTFDEYYAFYIEK